MPNQDSLGNSVGRPAYRQTPFLASWSFLALGPWEGSVWEEQSPLSSGKGASISWSYSTRTKSKELLTDHKPWAWTLPPFLSHHLQDGSWLLIMTLLKSPTLAPPQRHCHSPQAEVVGLGTPDWLFRLLDAFSKRAHVQWLSLAETSLPFLFLAHSPSHALQPCCQMLLAKLLDNFWMLSIPWTLCLSGWASFFPRAACIIP